MKIRAFLRTLLAATAVIALSSGCIPTTLHQKGLVCETKEDGLHGHSSTFSRWKIQPMVTRLQVDYRAPNFWKNFIDAVKQERTELQDIDMRVVNRSKNPLPNKPKECRPGVDNAPYLTEAVIPDFVFAYGIHEIENNEGAPEPKSPHMIVFLPLHTKAKDAYPETAQEFRLLLLHMEKDTTTCPAMEPKKSQCEALVKMRMLWNSGDYKKKDLDALAASSMKAIVEPETRARYHNGVIHGNF